MVRPGLICQFTGRARGKSAVWNNRGDSRNVGYIRSPLRATVLPDCGGSG